MSFSDTSSRESCLGKHVSLLNRTCLAFMLVILLLVKAIKLIYQKLVVRCAKNPLEYKVRRFVSLVMLFSFNKNLLNAYYVLAPLPYSFRRLSQGRERIPSPFAPFPKLQMTGIWHICLYYQLLSPGARRIASHWSRLTIFLNTEL